MADGFFLDALGNIEARGTAEEPIVFTSNSQNPIAGDWEDPIIIDAGSQSIFSHVVVEYGGEHSCHTGCTDLPMILVRGNLSVTYSTFNAPAWAALSVESTGVLRITDSLFLNGKEGVHIEGGDISIQNSSFIGIENGVDVLSAYAGTVTAINNWWGDQSGPRYSDNIAGIGSWIFPRTDFFPWLTYSPDVGATSTEKTAALEQNLGESSLKRPVVIVPGILGSFQLGTKWILDPVFHTYDGLVTVLERVGYGTSTLFTFPYDWRRSNVDTGNALKDRIEEIKHICGCPKVDVVAHSMGGLAVRSYIESVDYRNDVADLIFLGTPQHGAPLAYLMAEGGEMGSNSLWDRVLKILIDLYARAHGYKGALSYMRSGEVPSVSELLPIYGYIDTTDYNKPAFYPDGYPANLFLENLDRNKNSLSNPSLRVGNIVGNSGTNTLSIITADKGATTSEKWMHGTPIGFEYDLGDGTVPMRSAFLYMGSDTPIASTHSELPDKAASLVLDMLGATTTPISSSGPFFMPRDILIISMHSPAKMSVLSPVGEDALDTPGVFYSGDDAEIHFISIPDPIDGTYEIEVQGTGYGEYTVETESVSDATSSFSSFTDQITPSESRSLELKIIDGAVQGIEERGTSAEAPAPPVPTDTEPGAALRPMPPSRKALVAMPSATSDTIHDNSHEKVVIFTNDVEEDNEKPANASISAAIISRTAPSFWYTEAYKLACTILTKLFSSLRAICFCLLRGITNAPSTCH
ncbi:MAG TPA: hypothetical protein VHE10_01320 [Candidatus Paceibacterota bacterium]|nr:hypothetical protein [Candidatus Paceibacterota bacterium]